MQQGFRAETPLGYQQVTATGAAFGLSLPASRPGLSLVLIQAEAQALRWRDDGTDPTAAIGYLIPVNGELRYTGKNPGALRLIAAAGGAIANITYY